MYRIKFHVPILRKPSSSRNRFVPVRVQILTMLDFASCSNENNLGTNQSILEDFFDGRGTHQTFPPFHQCRFICFHDPLVVGFIQRAEFPFDLAQNEIRDKLRALFQALFPTFFTAFFQTFLFPLLGSLDHGRH